MQVMLFQIFKLCRCRGVEVLSDTELRIKREFGGDSGKGTVRFRGCQGSDEQWETKESPQTTSFVDQQECIVMFISD